MKLEILTTELLETFKKQIAFNPEVMLQQINKEELPVDYFQFYHSVSSVYSSKIEGEEVDFDSFYKHKFLNIPLKESYIQKSEDLFAAYEFIENNPLNGANVKQAHRILSRHLLPEEWQGRFRSNPMFVLNSDDRIEYVACDASQIENEWNKLFSDIAFLLIQKLNIKDVFYFAAMLHLVFVKIHPFQDGNGRTARLMEKWFLISHLGKKAHAIPLEKNYYRHLEAYYRNIKQLGLEYAELDYSKAMDFLLMTINGLKI